MSVGSRIPVSSLPRGLFCSQVLSSSHIIRMTRRGTRWCFTCHYGRVGQLEEYEALRFLEERVKPAARYLVYGAEVCLTGQHHLQGYVEFSSRKRVTALVKLMPSTFWAEAKGTAAENREYCTKDEQFDEFGKPADPGKKESDKWAEARRLALDGEVDKISDDRIYITSYSSLTRIAKDNMKLPANLLDVCGIWYHGESGVGKSHKARELFGDDLYLKPLSKWWDGYTGQASVLLEDVDSSHSFLGYWLKIWADRYAFQGEVKNGALPLRPLRIIVT